MKRIFFVEDDLSLIQGLSFALKKQGYKVDFVRTCAEAREMWKNGTYDLECLTAAAAAVYGPARKMKQLSVTGTIHQL